MQQQNTQEPTTTPAVETALNRLGGDKPKSGEKLHSFVRRCVGSVQGRKQREQLYHVIMQSLNELGLKAVHPAQDAQAVLNTSFADAAALHG